MSLLDTLLALPPPPQGVGRLDRIILRPRRGAREERRCARLVVDGGVEGDRWAERSAKLGARIADREVTLIRSDIAQALAAPQDAMWTGDNLHVTLDISEAHLPAGSLLRIGAAAVLELTARRHLGCGRFSERFGREARAVNGAEPVRGWRVRGALLRVRTGGEVCVGDLVVVEQSADLKRI